MEGNPNTLHINIILKSQPIFGFYDCCKTPINYNWLRLGCVQIAPQKLCFLFNQIWRLDLRRGSKKTERPGTETTAAIAHQMMGECVRNKQ
jgi:hypothetical protein